MKNIDEITDDDRVEILRLVLLEASGREVSREMADYPLEAVEKFRSVTREAGLVKGQKLTERGKRRLGEYGKG